MACLAQNVLPRRQRGGRRARVTESQPDSPAPQAGIVCPADFGMQPPSRSVPSLSLRCGSRPARPLLSSGRTVNVAVI